MPFVAGQRNIYASWQFLRKSTEATEMNGIIYLVGLVVIVMAILSLFGLR